MKNGAAFITAVVFAAILFFGSKIKLPQQGERFYRRWISFSAGVGIAYVFLELMPELNQARDTFVRTLQARSIVAAHYRVYLAALIGFVFFYVMHSLIPLVSRENVQKRLWQLRNWPFHFYMAGFFFYVWLLTYVRVNAIEEVRGSNWLYTLAMGLHLFLIDYALRREYKDIYLQRGKNVLACAALLGWCAGNFLVLPVHTIVKLGGFIAGGIMMNTMVMEMPHEHESRIQYFLLGTVFYSALILTLK